MIIVLVGFMGVGKTTVGKALAERLKLKFLDTDEIIERQEGRSVSQIFDTDGEEFFRRLEDKVLRDLLDQGPAVISTGGGTFENPELRMLCKEKATSIWLAARLEHLFGGMEQLRKQRPMLKLRTAEEIRELHDERSKDYADCDICVEVDGLGPEEVVGKILEVLVDRDAVEEAAREYAEIIMYGGEPASSPEAIFQGIAGRKPTPEESRQMMRRIDELLQNRRRE